MLHCSHQEYADKVLLSKNDISWWESLSKFSMRITSSAFTKRHDLFSMHVKI